MSHLTCQDPMEKLRLILGNLMTESDSDIFRVPGAGAGESISLSSLVGMRVCLVKGFAVQILNSENNVPTIFSLPAPRILDIIICSKSLHFARLYLRSLIEFVKLFWYDVNNLSRPPLRFLIPCSFPPTSPIRARPKIMTHTFGTAICTPSPL